MAKHKSFADMDEDQLQDALNSANDRKDEAKAEATEITKHLDALRTRERLDAKIGGLSEAEKTLIRKDAVAKPQTVGAVGKVGKSK
jgi:hypothetical protein